MDAKLILEQVRDGRMSVEEAEAHFMKAPIEEMGHAVLDLHRDVRSGFHEVVYCSGKLTDHLVSIYQKLYEKNGEVFGTRANAEQYAAVKQVLPEVEFDSVSGILKCVTPREGIGNIAVCTAGTSDIPVAEEAAQTAEYLGATVHRFYDVGVSGLHRLLSKAEQIYEANAVVAVAGMEGALPTVLGGIVRNPVIAVPTSIGYGASFHGVSALLTMLNTCANGVATVNIDNGYGAGYLAAQINRLAAQQSMQH